MQAGFDYHFSPRTHAKANTIFSKQRWLSHDQVKGLLDCLTPLYKKVKNVFDDIYLVWTPNSEASRSFKSTRFWNPIRTWAGQTIQCLPLCLCEAEWRFCLGGFNFESGFTWIHWAIMPGTSVTGRGWSPSTSGTREKWGRLADENGKRAYTRCVPDVNHFWRKNKARGSDVDRFWVSPQEKSHVMGRVPDVSQPLGLIFLLVPKKGSCIGCVLAFGPNGVGRSRKSCAAIMPGTSVWWSIAMNSQSLLIWRGRIIRSLSVW